MSVVLPIPGSPAIQNTARLPLVACPTRAEAREFLRAADERTGGGSSVHARFAAEDCSGNCSRACGLGVAGWPTGDRSHRDEPIAAACDGFDVAGLLRIVGEHRPEIADGAFSTESLT